MQGHAIDLINTSPQENFLSAWRNSFDRITIKRDDAAGTSPCGYQQFPKYQQLQLQEQKRLSLERWQSTVKRRSSPSLRAEEVELAPKEEASSTFVCGQQSTQPPQRPRRLVDDDVRPPQKPQRRASRNGESTRTMADQIGDTKEVMAASIQPPFRRENSPPKILWSHSA